MTQRAPARRNKDLFLLLDDMLVVSRVTSSKKVMLPRTVVSNPVCTSECPRKFLKDTTA